MTLPQISVIIPFYQRETGLLSRCVRSVLAQDVRARAHLNVIVVDDESPLRAADELASIEPGDGFSLLILRQSNGGPGAARNRGLEEASADTDFIAFLDSDDEWLPGHLGRAVDALSKGNDFYFCDNQPADEKLTYFNGLSRLLGQEASPYGPPLNYLRAGPTLLVSAIDETQSVYKFVDGGALTAFVKQYLAHTSTIVFKRAPMTSLRFRPEMRNAGEDYLFAIGLAERSCGTVFSNHVGAARGRGVSIYESATSWDHVENMRLIRDNVRCFVEVSKILRSDRHLSYLSRQRLNSYRSEFLYVVMRRFVRRQPVDFGAAASLLSEDKSLRYLAPFLLLQIVGRKIVGKKSIDHQRAA